MASVTSMSVLVIVEPRFTLAGLHVAEGVWLLPAMGPVVGARSEYHVWGA